MPANISISAFAVPTYPNIGSERPVPSCQMIGIADGCARALEGLGELRNCIEVIIVRASFSTTYTENFFSIKTIFSLDSEKIEALSTIVLSDFDNKPKDIATDSGKLTDTVCQEIIIRARAYADSYLNKKLSHYKRLKRELLS